jgi:hypothetical protein
MDLSDAFRQQLSFKEPVGTRGAHADRDFSTSVLQTANARVEPSQRVITNTLGEEAVTTHFAMVDRALSLFARVWLPGADASVDQQSRRPIRVDAAVDLDGATSHWEVYF